MKLAMLTSLQVIALTLFGLHQSTNVGGQVLLNTDSVQISGSASPKFRSLMSFAACLKACTPPKFCETDLYVINNVHFMLISL